MKVQGKNKKRDLLIISGIYLLAYMIGAASVWKLTNLILKLFLFDVIATIVTFFFSVILHNSSVYDAYWSLTPMVMSVWLFVEAKAFGIWQILFLVAFNIWGARLTINWICVFTDFTYEDWRYKKYREETPKLFWPIVNFFGIHFMPTLVVFAGMLPLFEIAKNTINVLVLPGVIVILLGVALEHFADYDMHKFLAQTKEKSTCRVGLWNYSRHPNYLGEITVWFGVFLSMLPFAPASWYYGVGFLAVFILFNVVSIPLMEKRQISRRADYQEYRDNTSRLFLLPPKTKY